MLIRYKKSFEKIAMGLLSFMPDEKDLKKLQNTVKSYETESDRQLYLWKQDEDIIGLIGVDLDGKTVTVTDLSVNPSHRGLGVGHEMVNCLIELYEGYEIISRDITAEFISKCLDCEADNKA
ncbi:GNAT family N-acetyltransferase [Pradoshia sp. D12]|uniref:GNAT family N-acetyltransferase n=1 Tax=Bacillaceae TaxID=186817 RepID=UPI00080AE38F|nr:MULTISPECIES: GNAT family N-acetyltransferase [Bacillaceae]OCA83624.1 hypothetical protein A8L44_12415 [Bacillus sp. FJAT-27986]QFK71864.1 GNAT family N-acetyltransferase [Pradoshia sp. D12]TPF73659.1 GNAT family N-acetyltransferase [Bacillus sp. D12]